jgi:hypothetical protein
MTAFALSVARDDGYFTDRLRALEHSLTVLDSITLPRRKGRPSKVRNALYSPVRGKRGRPTTRTEQHDRLIAEAYRQGAALLASRGKRVTAIGAFRAAVNSKLPDVRMTRREALAVDLAKRWSALKKSDGKVSGK